LFLNTRADLANVFSAFNGLNQMHQRSVLGQPIGFQAANAINNYAIPFANFQSNPANFRPQMPIQPIQVSPYLTLGNGGVFGGTGPYSGFSQAYAMPTYGALSYGTYGINPMYPLIIG
jgi:hypothetical protein